jgi:hypothetical protein
VLLVCHETRLLRRESLIRSYDPATKFRNEDESVIDRSAIIDRSCRASRTRSEFKGNREKSRWRVVREIGGAVKRANSF